MCIEVKNPGGVRADAHRQKHVSKLGDSRIREDAFDVVLHEPDSSGQERRRDANRRDDRQRMRRMTEQDGVAANHVDTGGDHRRRMDEGRDRSRPFHRIGQPDVERDLRRFARRAHEQQQRDQRNRPERRLRREGGGGARHLVKIEGAEPRKRQQHAEKEAEVADSVDDEGFLAGVGGGLLFEPEADQQVRAQADAFPPDEQHQEIRAQHEHEHERREQVQVREVARVLGVALLVHVGR